MRMKNQDKTDLSSAEEIRPIDVSGWLGGKEMIGKFVFILDWMIVWKRELVRSLWASFV